MSFNIWYLILLQISRPSSAVSAKFKLQKASEISDELRQRRISHASVSLQPTDDASHRKLSMTSVSGRASRKSIDERSLAFSDDSDTGSGTDYNDDDVCVVKKDDGFRRIKGQPGMYYKVIWQSLYLNWQYHQCLQLSLVEAFKSLIKTYLSCLSLFHTVETCIKEPKS